MDLVEQSELLANARQVIANTLADIPAEVLKDEYDDGYWDGLKAAYIHALQLLGVGE